MQRGLALFIIIFHLTTFSAAAADFLRGTVVSVDRKNGRLILRQADAKKDIEIVISPDLLPEFVAAGVKITARGEYTRRAPDVFRATKITRERSREGAKDPTGVRSRLK